VKAPGGDRRRSDRRRNDRRRTHEPTLGETWLAMGGAADGASGESMFDTSFAEILRDEAPRQTVRRARDAALARVWRTYVAARAAVGAGLVAVLVALAVMGTRVAPALVAVCLAYAVQALTLWLLPRFDPVASGQQRGQAGRRQWLSTIGVDLVSFAALHWIEAGSSFNYAALLVLPVLMAGVTMPRLLALGTAAGVTLMLLLAAWRASLSLEDATNLMLQSGLAGLGLFLIALLSGELAGRLAKEELAARGGLELARQQALLNRLVIEEMADGVLVIDHRLKVRAANPAARALLVSVGLSEPAPFPLELRPTWRPLVQAVRQALASGRWPDEGGDVTLAFEGGFTRTLRLRVRFVRGSMIDLAGTGTSSAREPWAVLLLEDVRTAQARMRQEKLAAMGRVSAGVAHEIRNPLAAIAQANALLLEDPLSPTQQRLARIVEENVARLKRLVDDVMEVAPGAEPAPRSIDATAQIAAAAADWARTVGVPVGPDSRLQVELPMRAVGVVFDPEHLRRVLVNLLDNAGRHASAQPGSIRLTLHAPSSDETADAVMSVLSDGALIPPEVERHLFEPFFSTRSRGSGLGLYICRELCERYGARIDYRARPTEERLRNAFVVTMRRAPVVPGEASLPLEH
jgi:two-component system, NtrC family, sensor histidine kinase PilS